MHSDTISESETKSPTEVWFRETQITKIRFLYILKVSVFFTLKPEVRTSMKPSSSELKSPRTRCFLDRMEELNHDLQMNDHFKITHDRHQDKKTSFLGSMTNKLNSFIQKAKIE